MKKSKVFVIIAIVICGVLLVSSVVFLSLNPRFFENIQYEVSYSKMLAEMVSDANEVIDRADDTAETGGAADAYYKAFLRSYSEYIELSDETRVLLPTDSVSIPDKDVLYDKIKSFCESKGKEVVAEPYQSLKDHGFIVVEELQWTPDYNGLYIGLYSHEGEVTKNKIEIYAGSSAGATYTFEKKNGTWELTMVGEWMS
jgi:hypothetical protein